MSQSYIPSLTPLRGIAALMVVIYHYQVLITPVVDPERSFLINKWYIMVDFFFILSGFIITHVYQAKFRTGFKWPLFKKFMLARFARLYPLHLVTLAFMIGIYYIILSTNTFESLPHFMQLSLDPNAIFANITLLQTSGFFAEPTWNTPSWSISVEWWTYAIFPFLILVITRKSKWLKYAAFLAVIGAYLAIMFYFQPAQFEERHSYMSLSSELLNTVDVMVGSGFLRCISGFLLGMLVYKAFEIRWGYSWLSKSAPLFGLTAFLTLCWSFNIIPDIVSILLFGFYILMVAYNNGFGKKVFSIPGFQFLGDISYSIYMIHFPIILCYYALRGYWKAAEPVPTTGINPTDIATGISTSPPTWLAIVGLFVFILATIIAAYFTYTFIEKPMRDFLKNKFSGPKAVKPKKEKVRQQQSSRYKVEQ